MKGIQTQCCNHPETVSETVFLVLISLYTYLAILDDSLLDLTSVVRILSQTIVIIGIILFFYRNHGLPPIRKLVFCAAILIAFYIAAKASEREYLIVYAVFLIAAEGAEPNKALKVWLLSTVLALLTIFVLCVTGYLPDYILYSEQKGTMHCLGFSYHSLVPFLVFYCSIVYICLQRDKVRLFHYAAVVLVNLLVYHLTKLYLTFYLTFIFVALDGLLICLKKFNLNRKAVTVFSGMFFPLGITATYLAMRFYKPENAAWVKLDRMLHNRLHLMHIGYLRYPISLFGNHIEMIGNSALRTVEPEEYFYIDSGFAYSLLGYGLIFSFVAVCLYSLLCVSACRRNDKHLFAWLVCVLIFTMMNNVWIDVYYNPALLLSFAAYLELSTLLIKKDTPVGSGTTGENP